jgi:hypothetical protein
VTAARVRKPKLKFQVNGGKPFRLTIPPLAYILVGFAASCV